MSIIFPFFIFEIDEGDYEKNYIHLIIIIHGIEITSNFNEIILLKKFSLKFMNVINSMKMIRYNTQRNLLIL